MTQVAGEAGAANSPAGRIGPAGVPRQVTARATWLLAPNPGPMTFDGTNSWVLHEPGQRGSVIVDPGPDDPAHLSALVALALAATVRAHLRYLHDRGRLSQPVKIDG
jgi:hypothetical protein